MKELQAEAMSQASLEELSAPSKVFPLPTATLLAARDSQQLHNLSPSPTTLHHNLFSNRQQQPGPPPQLILNHQQQPRPPPALQHPAQHNGGMQSLRIYNSNNADQQWSQGADGPTVNNAMFSVNPMQHFLAFLQQQMYGQQQLPHQQQLQLYTTENSQQLIMGQDSSNNNNRDGLQ